MTQTRTFVAALALLACACKSPAPTVVEIDQAALTKAVAAGVAAGLRESPKMGASLSGGPNYNITEWQNQNAADFEPSGTVTWVDGGVFSDGGSRGLVATPTLPGGRLWKSFTAHCPGTTSGNAYVCFDAPGSNGIPGQIDVCQSVPCDSAPLPIMPLAFYLTGMDGGAAPVILQPNY